jgi:uncharacterized membrane protein
VNGLITLLFAVFNAFVMFLLFRYKRTDRNLAYLLVAIVVSFAGLFIPLQLKGHVITLFWAAESVILLFLYQKTRIKVLYIGFMILFLLTLFALFMDIGNYTMYVKTGIGIFITGISVIVAAVINMMLLKRDPVDGNNNKQLVRFLRLLIIALAYLVPFLELNVRLAYYTDLVDLATSSFRYVSLATFTSIFIAVLGIEYRKEVSTKKYVFGLLYLTVFLYTVVYSILITGLRYDIFGISTITYPAFYFSIHLLSLPAISYIIYLTIKNIQSLPANLTAPSIWLLTILTVITVSVETENIVVWILGHSGNYTNILYDIHTFGYPILWGFLAMILMIWGLRRKESPLRMISLVFFGIIIVKFYVYDVWKMSQSGRIISFVLLGVILLLVSFLQQKIRTFVKNDKNDEAK